MDIIKLLKSYVDKEQLNIEFSDSDIKLLLEQQLQPLLYPVTQDKKYKSYYVSWVLKQEMFYSLQDEITNIFNSNNINHIYFKGSILSKIYDDPSVRTRGDIDLYIDSNDFNKAKSLLLDNGYLPDKDNLDCMHHEAVEKNGIEVELHFRMLDSDMDKASLKLFESPFELCDRSDNNLYYFSDTYHLIYCIIHFARHLRHGAGLRYILDFYYMFLKTKIDFSLLHKEINKLNLNVLYSNIINAIRYIFDKDFDNSIESKDIKFFIDYMMQYGIHGNSNNDTTIMASHNNKLKYFMVRVFLFNNAYRKTRYPILYHWYLYPICLIKHWLFLITHKLNAFFKFIFGKNKNKKLYNDLGI